MANKDQMIQKLVGEMHWWDSLQIETRDHITRSNDAELAKYAILFTESRYKYTESSLGQRFLSVVHTLANGQSQKVEHFFDGEKAATIGFDRTDSSKQKTVSISRAFGGEEAFGDTARPIPLKFNYIGKVPLYEALEGAQLIGDESLALGPCEKYVFNDIQIAKTRQHLVYYLDKASSLPLRVDSFDTAGLDAAGKLWTWEVEAVDVVSGHPIAIKSLQTAYKARTSAPSPEVRYRLSTDILNVKYNSKFEKGAFWPQVAPEAVVHDNTKHVVRPPISQGDKSLDHRPMAAAAGTAVQPQGWLTLVADASWIVGIMMLILGFLLWRRRG